MSFRREAQPCHVLTAADKNITSQSQLLTLLEDQLQCCDHTTLSPTVCNTSEPFAVVIFSNVAEYEKVFPSVPVPDSALRAKDITAMSSPEFFDLVLHTSNRYFHKAESRAQHPTPHLRSNLLSPTISTPEVGAEEGSRLEPSGSEKERSSRTGLTRTTSSDEGLYMELDYGVSSPDLSSMAVGSASSSLKSGSCDASERQEVSAPLNPAVNPPEGGSPFSRINWLLYHPDLGRYPKLEALGESVIQAQNDLVTSSLLFCEKERTNDYLRDPSLRQKHIDSGVKSLVGIVPLCTYVEELSPYLSRMSLYEDAAP